MSRNLAILFAVLAISSIANAAASVATPSSAYSVAPGLLFTNVTDTAFTNLTGPCIFTSGFDNTTNYVWCQTNTTTLGTVAPLFQRRQINATAPATINATMDAKITTSILYTNGWAMCGGVGYLGIAYSYGSGVSPAFKPDVSFAYIAVNSTTVNTVKLTANADANIYNDVESCLFDNGIFYVIYTQYNSTVATMTANAVYIQGVNITSGLALYNATGGVKLWSPTTQELGGAGTLSIGDLYATNWTGFGSTMGILTYVDSSTSGAYKSYILPITLATGAPGTAVLLGTGSTNSATPVMSTTTVSSAETTVTTITGTTYSIAGVFGSLSTYGVALTKMVRVTATSTPSTTALNSDTYTYSSQAFINGSSTASATFNMTNPTGYYLGMLTGYSTPLGFGLTCYYAPVSGSTATQILVNKDTYFANGTAIMSAVSLGTFDTASIPQQWQDAAGSPWLGYNTVDSAQTYQLLAGYAGQILQQKLSSANVLSSIFATLALVFAALFAF